MLRFIMIAVAVAASTPQDFQGTYVGDDVRLAMFQDHEGKVTTQEKVVVTVDNVGNLHLTLDKGCPLTFRKFDERVYAMVTTEHCQLGGYDVLFTQGFAVMLNADRIKIAWDGIFRSRGVPGELHSEYYGKREAVP